VTLLSHLLRAWRWKMQLEALPQVSEFPARRISIWDAYASVLIGYMANSAVPRLGELVRAAHLAHRERLSLSSVFGTVVVERILDLITFALVFLISILLLLERPAILDRYIVAPAEHLISSLSVPILLIAAVAAIAVLALFFFAVRHLRARTRRGVGGGVLRLVNLLQSFRDGLLTLFRSPQRIGLLATTVLIWIGYWVMVHLPFLMLNLTAPYGLGWSDSWIILAFGTIGIALFPSPGGTGSYHYVAITTLVLLFSMSETDAATYAVVNHAALTLLNVLSGFVSLGLQGTSIRTLRMEAEEATAVPLEPPMSA
jgi:glycosyltransferase 2 family protein